MIPGTVRARAKADTTQVGQGMVTKVIPATTTRPRQQPVNPRT